MKFTKMQGVGNDYVYVDCFSENLPESERPIVARRAADRHFGIGSDGLICICPSEIADFKMDMYNADGSQGIMCGNGIRCLAKYVYDRGLTEKTMLSIETGCGLRNVRMKTENGKVTTVTVDLGRPDFTPFAVPVLDKGDNFISRKLEVAGREWTVTALSVGNPHLVVFVDEDVDTLDLEALGPQFENHPLFPKRINTEFVNILPDKSLKMRVWERGSGETLACGTGAVAGVAAAVAQGIVELKTDVHLPGGTLQVFWDNEANRIYLTGPAAFVYDGELPD